MIYRDSSAAPVFAVAPAFGNVNAFTWSRLTAAGTPAPAGPVPERVSPPKPNGLHVTLGASEG